MGKNMHPQRYFFTSSFGEEVKHHGVCKFTNNAIGLKIKTTDAILLRNENQTERSIIELNHKL